MAGNEKNSRHHTSRGRVCLIVSARAEAGVIRSQVGVDQDYVPTGKGWGVPDLNNEGVQKGSKVSGHGGGGGGCELSY